MRARDVLGRTIVRVIQDRLTDQHGNQVWDVVGFVLDNGRFVNFSTAELGDDYATEVTIHPRALR